MAVTLDAITLPEDLIWSDEYDWSNVVQSVQKSLTGALVIQEASQAKGRLITLRGGIDAAWITKSVADSIKAKVDTVDLTMTLNFHGTPYQVKFSRQGNKSPFETSQVYELANPDSEHLYGFTLRLMEV